MIGKSLKKILCTFGIMIALICNTVYSSNVESIQLRDEWTGDKKLVKPLVLLIDFNNYNFEDMKKEVTPRDFQDWGVQHYKDMCFGNKEYEGPKGEKLMSMKEYYKEQSGGSFIVDGDVFGWYTAKKDAEYYGRRYGVTKDANIDELVKEAFDMALEDPNIDLNKYDTDKNGVVDSLVIVHAGKGEEVGGGTLGKNAIWAHRNSLSESVYYGKNNLNTDRIGVLDYVIVPQDMGIGVMSHEYGHILGLNDEYNIHNSKKASPIGYWSIMASGSGAGISHGTDPTGFSPWCKQYLQKTLGGNWVNIREFNLHDIDEKGIDILLDEASRKGINNEVIRINLPKDTLSNERDRYYLLEWRNNSGTDRSLANCEGGPLNYDSGLVVWYIDENYSNIMEYDNNVAKHPGYGFSGVVDADQHVIYWRDEKTNEIVEKASSDYQIHDGAFRLKKGKDIKVSGILNKPGLVAIDEETFMKPIFDDSRDYSNKGVSEAGRILPKHGLKIYITGQSSDGTVGKIHILKNNKFVYKNKILSNDITSSFIRNITLDKNVIEEDHKAVVTVELNEEETNNEVILCYVVQKKGKEEEKYLTLNKSNGKYMGKICKDNDFNIGNWKIKYIVIENENEDAEIIYNAYTNHIVSTEVNKEDLSKGNLSIIDGDKGLKIENTTKEDLQNIIDTSIIESKLEQYKNATTSINMGMVLESEPNILGVDTVEYKKLNQHMKSIICTKLAERHSELNSKEAVQGFLNMFIEDEINIENARKAIKDFNDYMYDTWFIDENNINKVEEYLNITIGALNKLNYETRNRYENNDEYKNNKEKVIKEIIEKIQEESMDNGINKYMKCESEAELKGLLDTIPNELELETDLYNKINEDNKTYVAIELYKYRHKLNSKERIQGKLDEIVAETILSTLEDEYFKYYNMEGSEFVEGMEPLFNHATEALEKICDSHAREIIKSGYMSYEEINSKLKEIKSGGVTANDFKKVVEELQELIMNGDIDYDEGMERADQLVKQGENIFKVLEETGEYDSVDEKLIKIFEQSKGFL